MRRVGRSVCCTASFSVCSLRRAKLSIIYTDIRLDYKLATLPVQVYPFAFDPDVCLVDPPRVIGRFEPRAQTSFQFRGITLHPSPDSDVVDQQAALGKEFLDFTVGQ